MSRLRRLARFAPILLLPLALPLGGCLQSKLLYHPTHVEPAQIPATHAVQPWLENGELQGYARVPAVPRRIWFMCHGNAGQAAHRAYVAPLVNPDDALYILEYPGFGTRPGSPGTDAINAAASRAYRFVQARHPGRPVGVLGESIGTGPASTLATEPVPPERIILLTPYATLKDLAAEKVGTTLTWMFLSDHWDNPAALTGYRGRLDIVAAESDTIIPPHHARTLAEKVPGARFHLIPGGHNDWAARVNFRDTP